MSKALLYAANTTTQAVAAGGTVNFGSVVRRYGSNCGIAGGNAVISGQGYYDIDASVTLLGTATGTATLQILKDGVVVPGAEAQAVLASDSIASLTIPCTVRATCCMESTITVVLTGVAASVTNAAVRVVKS